MSCQGGIDGDLGRFLITDLANHDDVGGLSEHRSESSGKGHADLRIHLDLIDSGHLVLDRLLNSDDFPIGPVHVIEAGVERGGFS